MQEEVLKTKEKVILIVDDFAYNLTAVEAILAENGYEDILTATSGTEALSVIFEKMPDLVILDIMMPDMDGFEVCEILQNNELTQDIPVIMLTARTLSKDLERGFNVGAFDYIEKPFDKVELLARIKSALKLKQSKDEIKKSFSNKNADHLREFVRGHIKKLENLNEQIKLEIIVLNQMEKEFQKVVKKQNYEN